MKFKLILCTAVCLLSTIAKADLAQDAETIFNWAEKSFPHYFPTIKSTQTLDVWRYRYYPETGVYAGVNTSDNNIYVLGGEFGTVAKNVGSSQALLEMTGNSAGNNTGSCVKITLPAKGTRTITEHSSKGQLGFADGVTMITETIVKDATNTRLEQSQIDTHLKNAYFPENIVSTDSVIISYISEGMAYVSSTETSMKDDRFSPEPIKTKATYNPGVIGMPVNEVCKNQTWKTNSSEQTLVSTTNGKETTRVTNIDPKRTFTVEAIDDVIATPVGSFNSVRIRSESDTDVRITWGGLDKGVPVKSITTYKNSAHVTESILTNVQYP